MKSKTRFSNSIPVGIYIPFLPSPFISQYILGDFHIVAILLLTRAKVAICLDVTRTFLFLMAQLINTDRNARAVSLAAVNQQVANNPEYAQRIAELRVSVDAARNSVAARTESPFQDGLFVRLVSTNFEESVGVRFFEGRRGIVPVYSILVNIYRDAEGRELICEGESLYGTMLRRSAEARTDVVTGVVVQFAENSFNLTPGCTAAQTLLELFNALVNYSNGGMMRIVSTPYTGLNRRGEQALLHVVSLVRV